MTGCIAGGAPKRLISRGPTSGLEDVEDRFRTELPDSPSAFDSRFSKFGFFSLNFSDVVKEIHRTAKIALVQKLIFDVVIFPHILFPGPLNCTSRFLSLHSLFSEPLNYTSRFTFFQKNCLVFSNYPMLMQFGS